MRSIPQNCTLTTQKSCGIRVDPDLYRMVSVLGGSRSLVGGGGGGGGRVQFGSLLLRTDETNT